MASLTLEEKIRRLKYATALLKAIELPASETEPINGKPTQENIDDLLAVAEAVGVTKEELMPTINEILKRYDNKEAEKTNTSD